MPNIEDYFPEVLYSYPLNKRILDVFQKVWDDSEEEINNLLYFYDSSKVPTMEKYLRTMGIEDLVIALSGDINSDEARGLVLAIKTFLGAKGTVKALQYIVEKVGITPHADVLEWFEEGFVEKVGASTNEKYGTVQFQSDLEDTPVITSTLVNNFESLAIHLLPWYLLVYSWLIRVNCGQDIVPQTTDDLLRIVLVRVLEFQDWAKSFKIPRYGSLGFYGSIQYLEHKHNDNYTKRNDGVSAYNKTYSISYDPLVYGALVFQGITDKVRIITQIPLRHNSIGVRNDGFAIYNSLYTLVQGDPELPVPLSASIENLENPSGYGKSDGYMSISVVGGTQPYWYLWNTGSTNPVLSNIPAGIYSITVTDKYGESVTLSDIELIEPAQLTVEVDTITDVLIYGESTGSISLNVSGGVPPYTYLWSNGTTNETLENVPAGYYFVFVTDSKGNTTYLDNMRVMQPGDLVLSLSRTHASGVGVTDGEIDANTIGGDGSYEYVVYTGDWTELA